MRLIRPIAALAATLLLAACDVGGLPNSAPIIAPQAAPPIARSIAPIAPRAPSAASAALATYYKRVQNDLLVRGLLRSDGGGIDTPYTSAMLARNFERIAFFDEYSGGTLQASNGQAGKLKRWDSPVRFSVEFGASVDLVQQARDRASVSQYAARLARDTGHPIGVSATSGNFHVLFMGQDDSAYAQARVQQLVPRIDPAALRLFGNLPRSIHCLVVAFSDNPGSYTYTTAIALIRAEHPDLLRRSCVHEELAQGLGLANDSPAARPSIFNDDDEFALLTTHDSDLLGMLYDPRLTTGMSLPAARPILRTLAAERRGDGGNS